MRSLYDPLRALEPPIDTITLREVANSIVFAGKRRQRRIKENAEIFQKRYGIKYCPFHRLGLVEEVEPDAETIEFYGTDYKFTYVECATDNLCHSNISFDKGLINKIKDSENLIEVQQKGFTKCVTCGGDEGKVYFTGFYIPVGGIEEFRKSKAVKLKPGFGGFWDREKLYLFERPCHTYLVANFGGLNLKPKKSSKPEILKNPIVLSMPK